mmetsp:Transcript_50559/g.139967  ORF Transcript_50559/g.139967 Transcript_50559/m.139967 type:complete len:241 (+) Transcript_50559:44-766(+)
MSHPSGMQHSGGKAMWDSSSVGSAPSPNRKSHCAKLCNLSRVSAASQSSGPLPRRSSSSRARSIRMFSSNSNCWNSGHRCELVSATRRIWARDANLTMGRVCRKSPASTIVLPPNGRFESIKSRNVLSRASRWNLFPIAASSQKMALHRRSSLAKSVCAEMLSVWSAAGCRRSHLKREWNVRPNSSRMAAIPDEATASTMWPLARSAERMVLNVYVLPVPPGASKNIRRPFGSLTAASTA